MPGPMLEVPIATVVVPTRDRPESLARTLRALRGQETRHLWELVVVDDGTSPPLDARILDGLPEARLLRAEGKGPARARNTGIAAARGRYVLFTDDDTEPAPGWVDAAVAFLEAHPGSAGVEGRVDSPPFDPLRAVSLESHGPGAYWTCNIAYRHDALTRVGGFDEGFPFPHCEDLDLAFRVLGDGPIGYSHSMEIVHYPRRLAFTALARRGRLTISEVRLFERHRERYGRARALPPRLFPLVQSAGYWRLLLRSAGRDPRRLARAVALASAHSLHVLGATLKGAA